MACRGSARAATGHAAANDSTPASAQVRTRAKLDVGGLGIGFVGTVANLTQAPAPPTAAQAARPAALKLSPSFRIRLSRGDQDGPSGRPQVSLCCLNCR